MSRPSVGIPGSGGHADVRLEALLLVLRVPRRVLPVLRLLLRRCAMLRFMPAAGNGYAAT